MDETIGGSPPRRQRSRDSAGSWEESAGRQQSRFSYRSHRSDDIRQRVAPLRWDKPGGDEKTYDDEKLEDGPGGDYDEDEDDYDDDDGSEDENDREIRRVRAARARAQARMAKEMAKREGGGGGGPWARRKLQKARSMSWGREDLDDRPELVPLEGEDHAAFEARREEDEKRKFLLMLQKALLHYGAPSHRIEEQLQNTSDILGVTADFVYLPGLIVSNFHTLDADGADTGGAALEFVRADGHIALSSLHKVNVISRKVLHDKQGAERGSALLRQVLEAAPRYTAPWRIFFAFVCSACISSLEFGGSVVDMLVAGGFSALLKAMLLRISASSETSETAYEISGAVIISFVSRVISTLRGNVFCYNAISSAGIILILPGFTVLTSALEMTSGNIVCGSVRLVYALLYTLLLGFSMTIGSETYLGLNKAAEANLETIAFDIAEPMRLAEGVFSPANGSAPLEYGNWVLMETAEISKYVIEGCYRDPRWAWYRQPLPWWTLFALVPAFSVAKSLYNLQSYRSVQIHVMIAFSCITYGSTVAVKRFFSEEASIVSAVGALTIGLLASVYSRIARGTAYTSAVTGILFLVPTALAGDTGLSPMERASGRQSGADLAIRMVQVAFGITVGVFVSTTSVYAIKKSKRRAFFSF